MNSKIMDAALQLSAKNMYARGDTVKYHSSQIRTHELRPFPLADVDHARARMADNALHSATVGQACMQLFYNAWRHSTSQCNNTKHAKEHGFQNQNASTGRLKTQQ